MEKEIKKVGDSASPEVVEEKKIKSLYELGRIIFRTMPKEEFEKHNVMVFDRTLTLKDRFIADCLITRATPQYGPKESRRLFREFMKRQRRKRKNKEFNFRLLNYLLTSNYHWARFPQTLPRDDRKWLLSVLPEHIRNDIFKREKY